MRLTGNVFDFGDRSIREHLVSISEELREQSFLNGEDGADQRHHRPLADLAALIRRLAAALGAPDNP